MKYKKNISYEIKLSLFTFRVFVACRITNSTLVENELFIRDFERIIDSYYIDKIIRKPKYLLIKSKEWLNYTDDEHTSQFADMFSNFFSKTSEIVDRYSVINP